MSLTTIRVEHHYSISSSKGFLKGENYIAWVVTMCSSKIAIASSKPEIVHVLVFLNLGSRNVRPCHSFFILASDFSMKNSFYAFSPISSQIATWATIPRSINFCKLKSSSGHTVMPDSLEIAYQWRSFMPLRLSATAKGTIGLNSSIFYFIVCAISKILGISRSRKKRKTWEIVFWQFS